MRTQTVALILALWLPGCATSSHLPTLTMTPEEAVYRLGSGDQLKITVYGEERLTGVFPVNGEGKIAYPLLGELTAAGKTLQDLEGEIRSGLADGYVNNPSITVEIANYRPYYILGEVAKPGEYAFVDGLSIFSAVARAGGFTYRADQRRIYIRHNAGKAEKEYRLDGDTPVQPGDTVRVGERTF